MRVGSHKRFSYSHVLTFIVGAVFLSLLIFIPSSSRATDFVKLGSPAATPIDLWGITSVYDRSPKNYEAWAVGEQLDANGVPQNKGIVLYYNGISWSRVALADETPPLRAVAAVRYVRFREGDGRGIVGRWSSTAMAVGDGGTILRLDPYSGTWKLQQKYKLGQPMEGKACADVDLSPDPSAPGAKCENWTTQNLKAVAMPSGGFAVAGGVGKTLLHYHEYFDDKVVPPRIERWVDGTNGQFLAGDEIRGVNFLDSTHGWVVGVRPGVGGQLWRYRIADGYVRVYQASASSINFTSVTSLLKKSADTPGDTLNSVVWIGAEAGATGKIIRYDEQSGSAVTTDTSKPIRSIALGRRAGGQSGAQKPELVYNGNFEADRKDSSIPNRFPDGWNFPGTYKNARGNFVDSTAIVDADPGAGVDRALVLEPWMNISNPNYQSGVASGGAAFYSGPLAASFPDDFFSTFASPEPYQTTLGSDPKSTDVTKAILNSINLSLYPDFQPYQYGTVIKGMIKVDPSGNNDVDRTVRFKIDHPFGRVAFNIENDDTSDKTCYGSGPGPGPLPDGATCINDSDCSSNKCRDRTTYISPTRSIENAAPGAAWVVGTCSGDSSGKTQCFDNADCQWGWCNNDPAKGLCRPGDTSGYAFGFYACDAGETCVAWSDTTCSGASPTGGSTGSQTLVTFKKDGGIKARVCNGGIYSERSCVDSSQCGGSPCQLRGSGWYPFTLRYYQTNTGRCSLTPSISCLDSKSCPGAGNTCVSGTWCQSGVNQGKSCTSGGDCPGGACVPQYTPGVCELDGNACWTWRRDCALSSDNLCTTTSNPVAKLTLQWDPTGGFTFSNIPTSNLLFIPKKGTSIDPGNTPAATQEIPATVLQGNSFNVTGRYKVEINNEVYNTPQPNDPRLPQRGHAYLILQCNAGGFFPGGGSCGYDNFSFGSNPLNGVTNGTCQSGGNPCKFDSECSGAGNKCNAGFQNFSVTLTKQKRVDSPSSGNRTSGDDGGRSLELFCFADYGAKITCDNVSVVPANDAAEPAFDSVDVWAVGDSGVVFRNTFNLLSGLPAEGPGGNWKTQNPTEAHLRSVFAPDSFNFWAAGDPPRDGLGKPKENATLLKLSPGNVNGWAWAGASSTATGTDPTGWIDFNCGNLGSCAAQPSSFGVNLDLTSNQFSGTAWLGNQDPAEVIDFGPCENSPPGYYCEYNNTVSCFAGDDCKDIVRVGGRCEFTGAPCNADCGADGACKPGPCHLPDISCGSSNLCSYFTSRRCSDAGQCMGTCAQNEGFRCTRDSDCKVSCAENPVACRSQGWLSFDRNRAGTPPAPPFNGGESFTANFDPVTDKVDGWARFQIAKCSNAKNLGCFRDSDCPSGGFCDYSDAISRADPSVSNAEAGWVKLRGPSVSPPVGGDFYSCQDCDPSLKTCKICSERTQSLSCNTCGIAAVTLCQGRCSNDVNITCSDDTPCTPGGGKCQSAGRCVSSGVVSATACFDDSVCGTGTCQYFGKECSVCATCNQYGVSIDKGGTQNFFGFGWSPDLGWIDFARVTLGGQLFFQTELGDIFAGQQIGGPLTGRPPGFPGSSRQCNATYRIVSAGTITNFCTFGQPEPVPGAFDITKSPYIQPGAQLYPLPSAQNRYTSQIGTLDIDGLTTVATTVAGVKKNKFGDTIEEYSDLSGTVNLSTVLGCPTQPCNARLLGKVYHIKGDLSIDLAYTFKHGESASESGAGTFIVDGQVKVNANLAYQATPDAGVVISNRRQLPSVAFIARDTANTGKGVVIAAPVTGIVGVYYTEKSIEVQSIPPDQQFIARGLMIAQSFNFRRTFRGVAGRQPAENVIYDGRIQANTPPGLSSLAHALPNLEELIP